MRKTECGITQKQASGTMVIFLPVSKRRLDPEAGRKQVSPKTQKMEGRAGNGEGSGEGEEGGAEKFQFRKAPETLLIHVRRPPMPQSPSERRGEGGGESKEENFVARENIC